MEYLSFSTLQGTTLKGVYQGWEGDNEVIYFVTSDGTYKLLHVQDCCEVVAIEDICGEAAPLKGAYISKATEEMSNKKESGMSYTWTFYHIQTPKGDLTIRWYGTSNGYYSETVDFLSHKGPLPPDVREVP